MKFLKKFSYLLKYYISDKRIKLYQKFLIHGLNNGYKLNVWNRTKSKVISLSKAGANQASDLNDIAKMSDVLITML